MTSAIIPGAIDTTSLVQTQVPVPLPLHSHYHSMPSLGPKTIPTPATEWAPRGRIIDDSARGTIFWEVDCTDGTADDVADAISDSDTAVDSPTSAEATSPVIARSTAVPIDKMQPQLQTLTPESARRRSGSADVAVAATADDSPEARCSGNAFHVDWLSVKKVPFYKTRGLRNPLNANREVKIARDGTELEATVGRKLLALFGPPPPPSPPLAAAAAAVGDGIGAGGGGGQ